MRKRKPQYPPNWVELAKACKEAAGWKCEWCGLSHGETCTNARGKPYNVVLTVHHPDGDTLNPNARLVALCQACHLRDDAAMHAVHARETRLQKRYEEARASGQLSFED